jgi:hypothetical protein
MSGADLHRVAQLVCDETLAMMTRYTHLAPDNKLAAVQRLGASFPDSQSDTNQAPTIDAQRPSAASVH